MFLAVKTMEPTAIILGWNVRVASKNSEQLQIRWQHYNVDARFPRSLAHRSNSFKLVKLSVVFVKVGNQKCCDHSSHTHTWVSWLVKQIFVFGLAIACGLTRARVCVCTLASVETWTNAISSSQQKLQRELRISLRLLCGFTQAYAGES